MVPIIIGITGPIASGKTTAAVYMEKVLDGAMLINVDKAAKDIYCQNLKILEVIRQCFGSSVFLEDGSINYRALGHTVFSSEKELEKLNNIMFPQIREKVWQLLLQNRDKKNIIIDAAILFDAGLDRFCDVTILVKAPFNKRKSLMKSKLNLSDSEIQERLSGQLLNIDEEKATFVIENNESKNALIKKTAGVLNRILNKQVKS